jgi:hypothetical protein
MVFVIEMHFASVSYVLNVVTFCNVATGTVMKIKRSICQAGRHCMIASVNNEASGRGRGGGDKGLDFFSKLYALV